MILDGLLDLLLKEIVSLQRQNKSPHNIRDALIAS